MNLPDEPPIDTKLLDRLDEIYGQLCTTTKFIDEDRCIWVVANRGLFRQIARRNQEAITVFYGARGFIPTRKDAAVALGVTPARVDNMLWSAFGQAARRLDERLWEWSQSVSKEALLKQSVLVVGGSNWWRRQRQRPSPHKVRTIADLASQTTDHLRHLLFGWQVDEIEALFNYHNIALASGS